mmetsp:Transcript_87373/g.154925  ORF Transcript_87373/g.154925 Transcript_87373/m.154925 type:complete len:642 (+) Transcript_87373:18-1943(+)
MVSLLYPVIAFACAAVANAGSFIIANDTFIKDGQPFNLRSGSLHYFRVPKPYWRDRMQRMKALGLNGVTAYVAWNYHEATEGVYTDLSDVTEFLDVAKSEGMLVVLRPGPYICAEWEFGGLPAWLLWNDKPGLKLRTHELQYMSAVERWLRVLYKKLESYTYSRDGPVAIIQIENEYGSFGNCNENPLDAAYMQSLLNLATQYFGQDVVYTTIDGGEGESAADLGWGSPFRGDARVLATVDGALSSSDSYAKAFQRQKEFNAPGHSPKMWSELWVGWFTVWLDAVAANKTAAEFRHGVRAMVDEEASFSLYMAHGGTNLGFWSGANGDQMQQYSPDITSYDYSSPISEGGDHNIGSDGGDLFLAVQEAIASSHGWQSFQEPKAIEKAAYGKVDLTESADLFSNLHFLSTCNVPAALGSRLPSFEDLRHNYGLVLYRSTGDFAALALNITAQIAHDRVQVFVDGNEVGTAYRPQCPTTIHAPAGKSMDLLVENMGRINYGNPSMYDYKGYLAPPPVPGDWTAHCLPLTSKQVSELSFTDAAPGHGPVFRRGRLSISGEPADTWLDMQGFTKGYVWVNGVNLGRYWEPSGPQHTLYLPAPYLKSGDNEVIVFDLHHSQATSLESVAGPRFQQPSWSTTTALYV